MKSAWMLVAAAGVAIAVGCTFEGSSSPWGRKTESPPPAPPVIAAPPATAPAPAEAVAASPDPEVSPLADRIQNYVGQFPPDDLDRKTGTTHRPAPAAVEPTVNAVAAAPPPTTAPTAVFPAVQSPPPAPAIAPSDSQGVRAMAPQRVSNSEAASPRVPVEPLAPAPALASPRVEVSEIRPAANVPTAAPAADAAPAANQPIAAEPAPPESPVESLLGTIQRLEQQVSLHPQALEDQFRLRLLYAITGDDDKATGPIAGTDPVQADVIAAVFRVVAAARKSIQDPAGTAPMAMSAIEELRRLVSQQSPVQVAKIAFVTRVSSFGDYQAVPPRFPAGQPVHVFLYTEVANFRSEPSDDGRLRTLLAEKVEIFDAGGKVIFQRSEPQIEDRVLTPRRDFFMTMEIRLPETTPAGEYILKVTVEDKLAATMDQQRLAFTIADK